jgi:hypothetical protein
MGHGSLALETINLSCRCIWVVSFTFQPLYSRGMSFRYTLHRRLKGAPQRPRTVGRNEKSFVSAGNQIPIPSVAANTYTEYRIFWCAVGYWTLQCAVPSTSWSDATSSNCLSGVMLYFLPLISPMRFHGERPPIIWFPLFSADEIS